MHKTLDKNETYTLILDHIKHGEYWLELVERKTGNAKILIGKRLGIFDGVTIDHAFRWMTGIEWVPMYKKGVM